MSGTGGIFPNYEDHQLDKKAISEHFAGNFHEIIYPLNYTSKYGPWQYHCPADVKNFVDMEWKGKSGEQSITINSGNKRRFRKRCQLLSCQQFHSQLYLKNHLQDK